MSDPLRLLCVFAHPDDESLGAGGVLARYAREGIATFLVTATRGERGWQGDPAANPGLDALGKLREQELRCAAHVLGLRELHFLDYVDGELDRADSKVAVAQIVAHIRRIRPHVVVTFGPEGVYGHPDHIAISQFTSAALVAAADATYADTNSPHRVSKFYYMVYSAQEVVEWQTIFGEFVMQVDRVTRRENGWAEWAITTRVDTRADVATTRRAVECHASQLVAMRDKFDALSQQDWIRSWGARAFYRAYSFVNGGRGVETDLFQGLRAAPE